MCLGATPINQHAVDLLWAVGQAGQKAAPPDSGTLSERMVLVAPS
jgi:hypothetical protein